jgi:hypothetical protein
MLVSSVTVLLDRNGVVLHQRTNDFFRIANMLIGSVNFVPCINKTTHAAEVITFAQSSPKPMSYLTHAHATFDPISENFVP